MRSANSLGQRETLQRQMFARLISPSTLTRFVTANRDRPMPKARLPSQQSAGALSAFVS